MEEQVTKVEQEVITTLKKASEFRHCPIHCMQCIAYALKPSVFWHNGILGSGLN